MTDAVVVVGLGFGDEGKGTITDYLARRHDAALAVRFNGGPQAGHNVITPEGTWHCFAQFGSGLFHEDTHAFCAEGMLVELEALVNEGRALAEKGVRDAFSRLTLDPGATLITPFHKMMGQMRELARGAHPKGTCGMGVGEAAGLSVRATVGDVLQPAELRAKLRALEQYAAREAKGMLASRPTPEMREVHAYFQGRGDVEELVRAYTAALETGLRVEAFSSVVGAKRSSRGTVVFEGAQGALLHCEHGFRPYVTPSRTTADAVLERIGEATVIGVLRPFAHRHGPGPLPTETALCPRWVDPYNLPNRWQGRWRAGWLDLPALRYAVALNGRVDVLALTNLDRMSGLPEIRVCRSYRYQGDLGCLEGFDHARRGAREAIVTGLRAAPAAVLERCTPYEYEVLPGWTDDISRVRRFDELPEAAQGFVAFLEAAVGVPVGLVSVSPTAEGKLERVVG